ncbi:MAG TPA: hypothetical protein VI916_11655 [Acidimicrobiia bacterium]|nr:hypothetical protein [Acidimicrobiia bacterium]
MEERHADDYVVRLAVRPRPVIGDVAPKPVTRRRLRRFVSPRLFVLAVVAVVALGNRSAIVDWADRALAGAKKPVQALHAEQHLDRAVDVLGTQWNRNHTFNVDVEQLAALDASVDWDEIVRYRSCLNGRAAVITADTATGTQARLIVEGGERGTVVGDPGCPSSRANLAPWTGLN